MLYQVVAIYKVHSGRCRYFRSLNPDRPLNPRLLNPDHAVVSLNRLEKIHKEVTFEPSEGWSFKKSKNSKLYHYCNFDTDFYLVRISPTNEKYLFDNRNHHYKLSPVGVITCTHITKISVWNPYSMNSYGCGYWCSESSQLFKLCV